PGGREAEGPEWRGGVAGSGAVAGNRRDHRLPVHGVAEPVFPRAPARGSAEALELLARAQLALAHIGAGAESSAGAADDRDTELGVGVELEEGVVDLFDELIVGGVELLRAVQDDMADGAVGLVADGLELRGAGVASGHRNAPFRRREPSRRAPI